MSESLLFPELLPYRLTSAHTLETLRVDPKRGLDSSTAAERLQTYGANELPEAPTEPAWKKFLAQFRDPLTVLLLVATVISFIAWLIERDTVIPFEAITILAVVILNGVLGYLQEARAEQAIAALAAMSAATARVLRDGAQKILPARELVPGDLLVIEEGDTIPADARVLESVALKVAEAALTGESAPVSKDNSHLDTETGIGDQFNMLFSGTAVTSGRGRAVVTATGSKTEIGKIAGTLQETEKESTPLQRELDGVGRMLGIVIIGIALVIIATILAFEDLKSWVDLVDVLLLAVSLAVAAVPEGLTAITTIVLSLGMERMARRNVIVRKLNAVETLGSTTVICSDKTGTLTKNEMTVRKVVTAGGEVSLTGVGYAPAGSLECAGQPLGDGPHRDEVRHALRAAHLANNARLIRNSENGWAIQGDPTEGALLVAARKAGWNEAELSERFPRVREVPFSSERKLMSTAHRDMENEDRYMVVCKGAPDVLLARCSHLRVGHEAQPLTPERRVDILAAVNKLASEALRTLGVAFRTVRLDEVTGEMSDDEVESQFVFLGVIGMIDPPRAEAAEAVQVARAAGVRSVMITGDHPATAAAIARELGISSEGSRVVTGAELQKMNDAELEEVVREASVYARVAPEHKLRIVRALKANGEIVAMTGDGVNDAPALKSADIGLAMGITGTDVSKGAADMILTDDNFASIVAAVEEGRAIFANIQKFLRYLLSSNMGEVFVMFFGVILAGAIGLHAEGTSSVVAPLLAVQILWINLLTDAAPALALGVDPADRRLMKRPPRDPLTHVINRDMWIGILLVGLVMGIGTLLVMDYCLPGGWIEGSGSVPYAQTMAFTVLVIFQLFNVFNGRSGYDSAFKDLFSNLWIWLAILLSALLQAVVLYVPFLQKAFGTVPLSFKDWIICIAVSSTVLWIREISKMVWPRTRYNVKPVAS
ncbi:MAG TPA: cation-translocating P-type ATPase [bacterium]|nr:cation-translocating P-type ATPase [bacterium]HPR88851.1 cation-translocating P-type ATPase [bacterium]